MSYLDYIIEQLGGLQNDDSDFTLGRWEPPVIGSRPPITAAPPILPPSYGAGYIAPGVVTYPEHEALDFVNNPAYGPDSDFSPTQQHHYQEGIRKSQGYEVSPPTRRSRGGLFGSIHDRIASQLSQGYAPSGGDYTPPPYVPPANDGTGDDDGSVVKPGSAPEPATTSQPVGGFWVWSGGEYDPYGESNSPGTPQWVPEGTQLGRSTGLYQYDPEQKMVKRAGYWQPVVDGVISPSGYYTKQGDTYVTNWGEGNYCWDASKGYHVRC